MKNPTQLDLPQGTLDLLILRVVALGPIHGYAIAQRIQQMSQSALQVQQGSLYPALHRLEYKKYLAADWRPSETARTDLNRVMTDLARAYPEQETGHTVARLLPLDVAVNSLDRFGKVRTNLPSTSD